MKRYFLTTIIGAMSLTISACQSTYENPETGEKITGESAIMAYMTAKATEALKDAPPACPIAPMSEIANLTEEGERGYFDALAECYDALGIAAAHQQPLTAPGEAATAGSKAIQAAEQSEASVASTAVGAATTLGLGIVAGSVAKAGFDAAQGDSYHVGNVAASNSVNGAGVSTPATGVEGELAATPGGMSEANGTRTNVIHIGPGNSGAGVIDNAPSAQVQNNLAGGQVDKPVSQDCAECAINDDDGGNDTSLF